MHDYYIMTFGEICHRFAKSKIGHLFIVYEWCNRREWSSSARE